MNPIEIIKKDHRRVEKLFEAYAALGDTAFQHKKDTAMEIIAALEKHAAMEETIAYPQFADAFKKEEDKMVEEAYAEHDLAKKLMSEISSMEPEDPQFDAKVTVLQENIRHHVKEEEDSLLPQAEKEMSEEELQKMGEEMRAFKDMKVL